MSRPPPAAPQRRLELEFGQSYLAQQRAAGAAPRDYQEGFRTVEIDPTGMRPVAAVQGRGPGGRTPLWLTAGAEEVVADSALFEGDLVAAVARVAGAAPRLLGRARPEAGWDPAALAEALIRGDVVRANTHRSAVVTLLEQGRDHAGWRSLWESVDTYYTNRRHVAVYRFEIALAPDGGIRLAAAPEEAL